MSDTPLVRLINLRKGFSKGNEPISIFDGLNLAIPSGDFAAVMGPSGSGKTTLLNLLGGIDRASADEILSMLQVLNGDLGKTIVMVTHDPAAAKYARRTLHLDKGFFIEKDLAA